MQFIKILLNTFTLKSFLFLVLFLNLSILLPPQYKSVTQRAFPLNRFLGVNGYEWNFLQNPDNPNKVDTIFPPKLELVKGFSSVRHYLDWSKIEPTEGEYTFNPSKNGSWNYDIMYQSCKLNHVEVLTCLKQCPEWMVATYPPNERDLENVPAPYGLDRSDPKSYILQAKAGFQFAARYGYNKNVPLGLVKVSSKIRWYGDPKNQVKIGMGLIHYIECDNERDKWWKGKKAQQSGSEYAANLSAFYDGDQGRLGKGVGVKNADPNMKVVMAGVSVPSIQFVIDMITWCKIHRGLKPDGSIDLCFDVINYHYYSNDYNLSFKKEATRGVAPELGPASTIAKNFIGLSNGLKTPLEVWITEFGYDLNPASIQRAIPIQNKSIAMTQADWLLRSCLLYSRLGLSAAFIYQLYDDNPGAIQYATSGLIDSKTLIRRPSADYILETKKLMGNYQFYRSLSEDPMVDVYRFGKKSIYVLWVPDEKGRTATYNLSLRTSKKVILHHLKVGDDAMDALSMTVNNGIITVPVSETPVFIEVL